MEFFNFFRKRDNKSKNVAKERLKLVLVHDRADLSPKLLEKIEADIIKVISKYVEIDQSELDIKLTSKKKDDRQPATSTLVANIPILKVKDK